MKKSPQRLSAKYRPRQLSEIVGQRCITAIQQFALEPYPNCLLFIGGPGCGKSCTAAALANELEVDDEFSGLYTMCASELGVDAARELFERKLLFKPMFGSGFRVVIIEELEHLSPQTQTYLKVALEKFQEEDRKVVVVATSNGVDKLQEALVQRFQRHAFETGEYFQAACAERLRAIWKAEAGGPEPIGLAEAGWVTNDRFSMRAALDQMEIYLLENPRYRKSLAVA